MLKPRAFYVDRTDGVDHLSYKKLTLRNRYIKWNIAREGIPADMPDGFWIVTLERNSAILPGLLFREV